MKIPTVLATQLTKGRIQFRSRVLYVVATATLTTLAAVVCGATPVALRFDATITHAPEGSPFQLGFRYDVGDVIHGKLSFEPTHTSTLGDSRVAALQTAGIEFHINGTRIASSTYGLRVRDNSPIFDFPVSNGPIDILSAECSSSPDFPACIPELMSVSEGEAFRLRMRLELIGPDDTVQPSELISRASQLNRFNLWRSLALTFDGANLGSMGFFAVIHRFDPIPEPASVILLLCGAIISCTWRWRRGRDSPCRHLFLDTRDADVY